MRRLLALVACAALGCSAGGQAGPTSAVPASGSARATTREAERPVTIEYVVIPRQWVERNVPTPPAELSAWYGSAEGRAAVPPVRRAIAFADEKKARAAALRLKKGEPYDKIAETSLEPGAPPESAALDVAYEKLEVGGVSDVVKSERGRFFLLKKERPSDEAIERAYRKAKAPEALQELATDILERMKKPQTDGRQAISGAVAERLGERAVADPDRPSPVVVDASRLRFARVPPSGKKALEAMLRDGRAGEVLPAPVHDARSVLVARTLGPAR